jgi:MFS transporter, DHA1 family, multidrug resistance protein
MPAQIPLAEYPLFKLSLHQQLAFREFIVLMALMSALMALSIDAMLPALSDIGRELGSSGPKENQLVISLIFLGVAISQLIYGPLSDSFGRKPMAYMGFAIFFAGCLLCIVAPNFETLLAGRVLQGVGLGGPRIISVALIRDQYAGREMARVMSFVMLTFILVPILAPAIGQGILLFAHWKMIFVFLLVVGMISFLWLFIRQPETLAPQNRHPFSIRRISRNFLGVCKNPLVMAYTIAAGIVFGVFMAYLSSVQQILQNEYGLGKLFALYFALLACGIGLASYINGKLVIRLGMLRITYTALLGLSGVSIIFLLVAWQYQGLPPLWYLMGYLMVALFCVGLLFGNLNALAMEPLGEIAGIGASVVGFLSSMLSVPLAILIGTVYNGTLYPLVIAFSISGILALFIIKIVQPSP